MGVLVILFAMIRYLAVLYLLLSVVGCRLGTDVVYDFSQQFVLAEVRTETQSIDFGTPDARKSMIRGWAFSANKSFDWSIGDSSEVWINVVERRPLTVVFRCWPLTFQGAPPQRITAIANGYTVDEIALRPAASEYRIQIPGERVLVGKNRLEFRYAYSRRPRDVDPKSDDGRLLAVAWDWLRIEQAHPGGEAHIENGQLVLPFGVQVDYYTKAGPGSVLTVEGAIPFSERPEVLPNTTLQIEFETASYQGGTFEVTAASRAEPRTFAIPLSSEDTVRFSFRALRRDSSAPEQGGIRVLSPGLRAPRTGGVQWQNTQTSRAKNVDDSQPMPPLHTRMRPNVLIYLIDALRSDHLGCYGYTKPTSPHIDDFASQAVLFKRAIAQSSWTRPCVASILTGLDPRRHHVTGRADALPAGLPTLQSILQKAGYQTAGFVTNGNVAPAFGFAAGFDTYEHLREEQTADIHVLSDRLNDRVIHWLETRGSSQPFFLYVHATDPHDPYTPHSPFRERFVRATLPVEAGTIAGRQPSAAEREDLASLYDAEIAFNDESFGKLIGQVEQLGLGNSTLILVLADHGEEFFDHGGWAHGQSLYDEVIHIPLILRFPDGLGAGTSVSNTVQQVDIAPTILQYAGITPATSFDGQSLISLITQMGFEGHKPSAWAHLSVDGIEAQAMLTGTQKIIDFPTRPRPGPRVELFDLASDPMELHDLASSHPVQAGYLLTLLKERWLGSDLSTSATGNVVKVTPDEALRERLHALGYGQ